MKWHGINVYTNNDFEFTRPRIYSSGQWKDAIRYIYTNGEWKLVGGACTQMVPFIDSNGAEVQVNGEAFLVRGTFGGAQLLDINNNRIIDANGAALFVDYRGV